jgi:hypothetical protein
MADVEIQGEELVVTIKGWHKFWAMKSRLHYPLDSVRGAEIDPETAQKPVGLRSPGAFIPSLLTAGSYRGPDGWDFWDMRNPVKAIVIALKDQNYHRLIVEVDDPVATVALINQALTASPGPVSEDRSTP